MAKPYFYAYNNGSVSARALSSALHTKLIRHNNSKFRPNVNRAIVNWGSGSIPKVIAAVCQVLNPCSAVIVAKDKLKTFKAISAFVSMPGWTEDKEEAQSWVDIGKTIVARTILNGHEGHGIVIVEPGQRVVDAPLYTVYIPKKAEYRVHVFNGTAIDMQQKVRAAGENNGQFHIRNHNHGFVFARYVNQVPVADTIPELVKIESIKAVKCLGLDFGAVDIIWNEALRKAFVLEVNTAPGIEGSTVETYEKAIRKHLNWNG